ncbi:MAG: Mur ligase family protein [Patescibacteria group bacterium]
MIKKIIKKIIIFLLQFEARLILKKYKPKIIAISGTVGKTSAKDAIYRVLSSKLKVRKSEKSYNNEIGVPLTIIGSKSGWNNVFAWIFNLIKGLKVIFSKNHYPSWLILETGVDRPGDMGKMLKLIRPDIGVITALGEIPVHIEYFKEIEDLIREKAKILQALKKDNFAILNCDDKGILELKSKIDASIITYGFSEEADFKASNYRIIFRKEGDREIPEGISFKVDYQGNIIPVRLYGSFGRQIVYAALASMAVGSILNFNLVEMAELLSNYESPPGRLRLLEGIKHSSILDDTYNSSPIAVRTALELLKEIPAKRKISVLGDMLELGKYTIEEHRRMGRMAKESADILFFIGPRSKFAAEEAEIEGVKKENIFEFSTSEEVKMTVQEKIKEGDLILIKGSQSMRMEKITEEIMLHPEKKEELLVRQEKEWLNRS